MASSVQKKKIQELLIDGGAGNGFAGIQGLKRGLRRENDHVSDMKTGIASMDLQA